MGQKIRALRKQAGFSLKELARKSGLGLGTLSRMENGKAGHTVTTHQKLCEALGISLAELYQDTRPVGAETVEPIGDEAETFTYDEKASAVLLARQVLQKNMLPQLIILQPRGKTHQEQTKLGCEKFLFVLRGRLEVRVGEQTYRLNPNGSLYFKASMPHQLLNTGKEIAKCLSITSPVGL